MGRKMYLPFSSVFKRPPAYYAPFERRLIMGDKHTGWVEYIGKGRFRLRKSPFLNVYSEYTYIYSGEDGPPENQLVSVEGRDRKIPVFNGRTEGRYRLVFDVESWSKTELHIPPPENLAILQYLLGESIDYDLIEELTVKDFLREISRGWTNAQADGLDMSIALQYLSCPQSLYGTGGIGSQVYSLGAGTKAVSYYGTYMSRILPREFLKGTGSYVFVPVRTGRTTGILDSMNERVEELNYAYLFTTTPRNIIKPVHLPLLIEGTEPGRMKDMLDPSVVAYQLSALMLRPEIPQGIISRFEDSIKEVQRLILLNDDIESSLDASSIPRIAEAMARLYMVERMDDDIFARASKLFLRYYKEYLDAKDVLERFRKGSTIDTPQTRISYLRQHLPAKAIKVLVEIVRYGDEHGAKWVPVDEIQGRFKDDIIDAIIQLQDYGYIIARENYTYVMPVIIDDELSEIESH